MTGAAATLQPIYDWEDVHNSLHSLISASVLFEKRLQYPDLETLIYLEQNISRFRWHLQRLREKVIKTDFFLDE